ncbi:hypothetical protein EXIGLDRAFT_835431 [Exidia glandulosa HHB12029]|uniref:Methyltransferase domain-containing protein n=1 Tax=Exidia glandulosa HHB12029 TaxID=1314781 RepID=A0A165IT54_EXIGL|nr:hypothetical protein EXIGLDRAFT_835431 [Exidia glandulosa HHB12029]
MLASPPPFDYGPAAESPDSTKSAGSSSMPLGSSSSSRRARRPHTAAGHPSLSRPGQTQFQGTSVQSEPRRVDMASTFSTRRATTSQLKFPAPPPSSPPPWVPSSVQECFVTRHGHKLHAFHVTKAPYPLCYDREFLDLDVMDHLELVKLKGGTGSMVDFSNGFPKKALDLGCGTGSWIMEAASQWPETRFVGFDLVPVQINLSLAHPSIASRVEWVHGNFLTHKLPFADGEFDHVHIRYISRGVPEDKWDVLFEEVNRVLCVGGSFNVIEEDILFPTLPRSFTAKPRNRRRSKSDEPQHDHALIEHLYFSVYERRFVNIKPTSILQGMMNVHFKHVYGSPRIDLPYPPPPISADSGAETTSASTTTESSPLASDPSPLPLPLPTPTPGTSHSAAGRPGTMESLMSDETAVAGQLGSKSKRTESFSNRSVSSGGGPIYHPVEATREHRLELTSEDRKKIKNAPLPTPSFSEWTPRGLALHLYHAYMTVLAMREAMWDELLIQMREEHRRNDLFDLGWDENEDEPRVRYERVIMSYVADMHARTSFKDALSESLGWVAPQKAPLTKAEIAFELDRERERTVARKIEEKMGFTEDTYMSRGVQGWCGFKIDKSPSKDVDGITSA